MPTSSYMPDVQVGIAFGSGLLTPSGSRSWTDVTDYVELEYGLTVVHGRQDEWSQANPNQLTLTLNNSDGRFTPGKTSGPYHPLKLDVPIRVTSDPVDGAVQTEGIFYVNEWPVQWLDETDATAYVTISASSRMARLGMVAGLKSVVEMAILPDLPVAYYTLGEPADSTRAFDSSGNRADPLVFAGDPALPVVFGTATGPGTDSLTAAQFSGAVVAGSGVYTGQYLSSNLPTAAAPAGQSLDCFFSTTAVPGAAGSLSYIAEIPGAGTVAATPSALAIGVGSTGVLVFAIGSVQVTTAAVVNDGATHHAAVTWDGTTLKGYIDGALSGSTAAAGTINAFGTLNVGRGFAGAIAHAAVFGSTLALARVTAHSDAGLNGYAGETTSVRLVRYAGYAGIPAAEVVTETGQTTVQHVDTTDKQVVELMRLMEVTEGGVLFDDRDGTLAFHNRAHRLTLSSAFTLDMGAQMVEAGYSPKLDRTAIANDITSNDTSGQFTAHVFDATSKTDNGVASMSIETASQDDDEPLFQASWALYKYKVPLPRVATLAVDCLAQVGKTPNCSTVLAANVGAKITVSNRPSQDSTTSATFFVEGYTRVYGPESCVTTFNVSPTSPEDNTYIVADVTGRGVIGTNPIAL